MARRSNRRRNTGKRNADMVTLVTWEHTKSRPTRRKVPYTHAVTMLDRGGFAKAQVLGEYDQILHERKSNRRRNPAARAKTASSARAVGPGRDLVSGGRPRGARRRPWAGPY